MAKTSKGSKWIKIPEHKRGNSTVKGHCRSTPNKRKK